MGMHGDHRKACSRGPLSHGAVLVCFAAWSDLVCPPRGQEPCKQCGQPTVKKQGDWHHLCQACNHERLHPSSAAAAAAPPAAPSPPPPLFARDSSSHSRLSVEQRVAINVLHKEGRDDSYIAARILCDVRTVRHWLEHPSAQDSPRSGR